MYSVKVPRRYWEVDTHGRLSVVGQPRLFAVLLACIFHLVDGSPAENGVNSRSKAGAGSGRSEITERGGLGCRCS
jgi:hypothetical protein